MSIDDVSFIRLEELYKIAYEYENDIAVKAVISNKLTCIKYKTTINEPSVDFRHKKCLFTDALMELSKEPLGYNENVPLFIESQINELPESAEKSFLLALFTLRTGTGKIQRIEAMKHISFALEQSRDPRYVALAEILEEIK